MCKCHLSANHFSPHVGWLRRCLHGYFCWSYLNDLWRNTPKWWNMAVCHRGMVINPFLDSNDWTDDPTLRMYDVWPWHKNISSYVYIYIYTYTDTYINMHIYTYIILYNFTWFHTLLLISHYVPVLSPEYLHCTLYPPLVSLQNGWV